MKHFLGIEADSGVILTIINKVKKDCLPQQFHYFKLTNNHMNILLIRAILVDFLVGILKEQALDNCCTYEAYY